jgi:hypothetical protein
VGEVKGAGMWVEVPGAMVEVAKVVVVRAMVVLGRAAGAAVAVGREEVVMVAVPRAVAAAGAGGKVALEGEVVPVAEVTAVTVTVVDCCRLATLQQSSYH